MGRLLNLKGLDNLIDRVTRFISKYRSCTRCKYFQGFNIRGFLHCEHTIPGEDRDDKWGADYDCRGEKYEPAPHGVYVVIYVEGESQEELERKLRDTIKSIKHVKAVYSFRRRLKPPFRYDGDPVDEVLHEVRVDLGVIPSQLRERGYARIGDREVIGRVKVERVNARHVLHYDNGRKKLILYRAVKSGDVWIEYELWKRLEGRDFPEFLRRNFKHFSSVKAVVDAGDYWIEYAYDGEHGFEAFLWRRRSISWSSRIPWFL